MEGFRSLIFIACFVAIGISMLDIITPEGKFKKNVRFVFSLVFIIVLLKPIVKKEININFSDFDNFEASAEYIYVQNTFYEVLSDNYSDNLTQSLNQKLKVNDISPKKISVNVNIDDNNRIDISEVKIVLAYCDRSKASETKDVIRNEIGDYPVMVSISEDNDE